MNHKGTVTIETNRLILRKLTEQDVENAYKNWTNDAEVTHYLTWPTHNSVEQTRKVICEYWIPGYHNRSFYQWAIELKEINEPIGTISVVSLNDTVKMAEVGYCIGKLWWNKGIMSEALTAIIRFLFEEVKVNRIQAKHDPENIYSGKVMAKCGMLYEGTLRQSSKSNLGLVDSAVYSILAEDYFSKR